LSLPFLFIGKPKEVIVLVEKAMRLNPIPPSFYYIHLGVAYTLLGRYDDSLNAFKKVVDESPDSMLGHIGMASAYSLLGRDEEARAEAKEVLRINPRFSLESYASGLPYKYQADKDLHINALRKAGLE
jgi:adenylate cyclase